MSDISEAPSCVACVLARSDGSRGDCGSSATAPTDTSAALVQPASPLLDREGFGMHEALTDADVLVEPPQPRQALTST